MSCQLAKTYILDVRVYPVTVYGQSKAFFFSMMAELGSFGFLDRLTIMQARPNRKKGNVSCSDPAPAPTAAILVSCAD